MTIELNTLGTVIKAIYEAEPNTNAFTDAEKAKLSVIKEDATANASGADLRDRSTHTGTQPAASIVDLPDLLAGKVDAVEGKGLSDENFTAAEKAKLASLEDAHFKGVHVGLSGLTTAHPAAEAGDYAVVDDGADLKWYQWDVGAGEWVARAGESTEITPAQVKSYYESNPDTNVFSDDEKARLAQLGGAGRFTMRRVGTWNAATNTPALIDGTGNAGDYYVVTTGGTHNFGSGSYNFSQYDWVLYTGGTWQRFAANPKALTWDNVTSKPDFDALYAAKPRGNISHPIPAVYARLAGLHPSANNQNFFIPWSSTDYDQFSMWSAPTRFTIPSWATHARVYGCVIFAANPSGVRYFGIRRNDVTIALNLVAGHASVGAVHTTTPIFAVNGGDYISTNTWQNSGGNLDVGGANDISFIQIELFTTN